MKERLEYNPEDLPSINLRLGEDREFSATPENTTLFTHLGRLACYDHVFMQTGDQDEETMIGTYVFRSHDAFEPIASFMSENNYPMVLNKLEVAACDVDAFNTMIAQQTSDLDSFPEDWLGEGES